MEQSTNNTKKIYDKYNNTQQMSDSELITAISNISTSLISKNDIYRTTQISINNAVSIDDIISTLGLLQEKTVTLIVDVDYDEFDSTNQVTNESLNQVVLPNPGHIDLSTISWLSNVVGVKSINGQMDSVEVVDSNNITTSSLVFSRNSPIVDGSILANGLPVSLTMVLYVPPSNNSSISVQ